MPTRLEQLVAGAAAFTPDGPAIKDRDSTWSYRELHDWSGRLTAYFSRLGLERGDRVAVWAPKSCRAVAAFQAVLGLGAAYVPIDPATPAPRAQKILDDCAVRLVVTTQTMGASLAPGRERFLLDDTVVWNGLLEIDAREPVGGEEDELAYILYTSGSTGTPKGVCISHRNALAFVSWAVDAVGITGREVFASHASFNFDISVFDLYAAFFSGGTVCLIPEPIKHVASKLVHFMKANRISVWYSVPSVLVLMIDHGGLLDVDGPSPSVLVFGGEAFPIRYVRKLRDRWPLARIFNVFGPTETNVCTSYEVVDIPADQIVPVPMGTAACGNRVWAVNDDGATAKVGEPGELYVDGPTVMLGYWGRERHSGPYPTGDICVLRSDGDYDFTGRRDHMVKYRGHRVEPGEIEAVLSQHPDVREVAVAATGEGADQRLVAFVVPLPGCAPDLLDLKAFGARYLPPYMLVDLVLELDALPRTPNGKIDRLALRHDLDAIPTHAHD